MIEMPRHTKNMVGFIRVQHLYAVNMKGKETDFLFSSLKELNLKLPTNKPLELK